MTVRKWESSRWATPHNKSWGNAVQREQCSILFLQHRFELSFTAVAQYHCEVVLPLIKPKLRLPCILMSTLMSINFWCSLLTRIINYDKFLFDWMPKFGWAEFWNCKSAYFPRALEHQADTLWKLACQRRSINVTTGYHSLPFCTCQQKSTHIFRGEAIHIQRIIKEVPKFQMVKMNYSSLIESNENTLILRAVHEQRWTHPSELCLCKHSDFCAGLVNMQVRICCHGIGMNKLSSFKRLTYLKKVWLTQHSYRKF